MSYLLELYMTMSDKDSARRTDRQTQTGRQTDRQTENKGEEKKGQNDDGEGIISNMKTREDRRPGCSWSEMNRRDKTRRAGKVRRLYPFPTFDWRLVP